MVAAMRALPVFPVLPVCLALSLTACGPEGNDPGPGGVTVDEARALDEAAEMLEQRRLPAEALAEPRPTEPAPGGDGRPAAPAAPQ